ncbi:MAG: M20/M25/M40 family metallo-hydrolase [Candidatus Thorarchaeota archaeon]|jgi:hypothetical protein
MAAYDYVKVLSVDIGPRPSGSYNNEKTTEYLRQELKRIGVDEVDMQEFTLRPDFWIGTAILGFSFSVAILFTFIFIPLIALVLSIVLPLFTILEIDDGKEISMRLLPSKLGRNIIGKEKPIGESKKRVILCAHHDSKTQAIPIKIRGPVLLLVLLSMIYLLLASVVRVLLISFLPLAVEISTWFGYGVILIVCFFFIYLVLNYMTKNIDQSPGAEDNATAVGVLLEVAKNLQNVPLSSSEVWFLFTDGEEIAMRGAIEFIKEDRSNLLYSLVINVEGCGIDAPISYSEKEMSVRRASASGQVIELIQNAAKSVGELAVSMGKAMTTDGYQFAKHGYKVSTIWRHSQEIEEVVHTSLDNIERLNPEAMEKSVRFIEECLRIFDEH